MITNYESVASVFATCSPGEKPLIGNSAALLFEANSSRKYAAIQNTSNVDITLSFSTAANTAVGKGIILKPGGSYEINSNNLYIGAISAISKFAAKVSFVECVE